MILLPEKTLKKPLPDPFCTSSNMLEVLFKEQKEEASSSHIQQQEIILSASAFVLDRSKKQPIMEAVSATHPAPSFIEFEPFCQWQREEARDVLSLHLPEFKKEQLKVQINNRGILKVSGERSIDKTKKTKFHKEVQVPQGCDANSIQAKFVNGCLNVIMPKKGTAPSEQTKPPEVDASGVDQKPKSEAPKDQAQKSAPAEIKGTAESSKEKTSRSPTVNSCVETSLTVAGVLAILMVLIAYVSYMYRSTVVED